MEQRIKKEKVYNITFPNVFHEDFVHASVLLFDPSRNRPSLNAAVFRAFALEYSVPTVSVIYQMPDDMQFGLQIIKYCNAESGISSTNFFFFGRL